MSEHIDIHEKINSIKFEIDTRILAIEVDLKQYKKDNAHDITNIKQAYNFASKFSSWVARVSILSFGVRL